MAEEELTTLPVGSPTHADGQNKRKLQHLDSMESTNQHPSSEANVSVDDAAAQCGGAVEPEPKRTCLGSDGDIDVPVSPEGNPEEENVTNGKESESVDVQELVKENPETNIEEPASAEKEDSETIIEEPASDEKVDSETIIEEPASAEKENSEAITEDPASAEKENPETIIEEPTSAEKENPVITEELQLKNSEEEPSEERPREGDVPVPATVQHTGSDIQILSRKMEVPSNKVGVLIGKQGGTIRSLQDNSGAKIEIVKDADADLQSATRPLEIIGTLHDINKAEKLIKEVIAEADAGGCPSLVARGFALHATGGAEQLEIQVPIEKVGFIIGKGGETIKNLQTRSGARIQLIQQNLSDGDRSTDKTVRFTGNKKQIETAREMIKDVMNQTTRPSPHSGGYSQQSFYPRGSIASAWAHRRPTHAQFSGYDSQQRGGYPSQGLKYPPPSSYSNHPSLHSPRTNLGPRWEQRPPPSMLGPSQGSLNYGGQQGPNQPPPYSQPYGHGYNEVKMANAPPPHSGYGPPPPDQFKPPMYGMQQAPPSQLGEMAYHGPVSSYGQNMASQQPYPMQVQQSYPPPYAPPSASGYQQPPPVSYPTVQPTYTEQPPQNNTGYGYQVAAAPGYPPTAQTQAAGYVNTASSQPVYPQYDTSQMYGSYA